MIISFIKIQTIEPSIKFAQPKVLGRRNQSLNVIEEKKYLFFKELAYIHIFIHWLCPEPNVTIIQVINMQRNMKSTLGNAASIIVDEYEHLRR